MRAVRRLQNLGSASFRPTLASPTGIPNLRPRYGSSMIGQTKFDQTKESNDPSKGPKPEHMSQAKQAGDEERDHPAKQPDPQPSPSKSTGVRREGPGSKAGEGKDKGVTKEGVSPSTGV